MRDRIAHAASRRCDGVHLSNVDGFADNQAGLSLKQTGQLSFNKFLAESKYLQAYGK